MRRFLWWVAPLSAAAVSAYLLACPTVATVSESIAFGSGAPAAARERTAGSSSLLETQGPQVALPLLIPILLAALPLLAWRPVARRALAAVAVALVGAFCVVSGLSVGMFYVPTLVILAGALLIESSRPTQQPSRPAA
jgi:hypothetical protein